MHLGHRIKSARILCGMSQKELALRINRSDHLIAHIEKSGNIGKKTLENICCVLHLNPRDLIQDPGGFRKDDELRRKITQLEEEVRQLRECVLLLSQREQRLPGESRKKNHYKL